MGDARHGLGTAASSCCGFPRAYALNAGRVSPASADDLSQRLSSGGGELSVLKNVTNLIANQGATFSNYYIGEIVPTHQPAADCLAAPCAPCWRGVRRFDDFVHAAPPRPPRSPHPRPPRLCGLLPVPHIVSHRQLPPQPWRCLPERRMVSPPPPRSQTTKPPSSLVVLPLSPPRPPPWPHGRSASRRLPRLRREGFTRFGNPKSTIFNWLRNSGQGYKLGLFGKLMNGLEHRRRTGVHLHSHAVGLLRRAGLPAQRQPPTGAEQRADRQHFSPTGRQRGQPGSSVPCGLPQRRRPQQQPRAGPGVVQHRIDGSVLPAGI